MDAEHRRTAVARAAKRIAQLNVERGDSFQDLATAAIDDAKDAFRSDVGAEMPGAHEDPVLDALMDLQRAIDASPEAVGAACDAALAAAGARVSSGTSPATH